MGAESNDKYHYKRKAEGDLRETEEIHSEEEEAQWRGKERSQFPRHSKGMMMTPTKSYQR